MKEHLKQAVVIIGFNRMTDGVINSLEMNNEYQITGVIDLNKGGKQNSFKTKHAIFNGLDHLMVLTKAKTIKYAILCLEDGKHRKDVSEYIQQLHPELKFLTVVHPSAVIGKKVVLGKGSVIGAASVINSDTKIGDFCLVKDHVSIGHDGNLKNFVTIQTNATIGGDVSIGNQSHISTGSNIINNVQIGDRCFIKEKALVLKNIPDGAVAEGIPAKLTNKTYKL